MAMVLNNPRSKRKITFTSRELDAVLEAMRHANIPPEDRGAFYMAYDRITAAFNDMEREPPTVDIPLARAEPGDVDGFPYFNSPT